MMYRKHWLRIRSCLAGLFAVAGLSSVAIGAETSMFVDGFMCIGAYADQETCNTNSATECLNQATAACGEHGGLSSYSCESCAYYENPTFAALAQAMRQDAGDGRDDTCPGTGGANGYYSRMWYYCNE